jgi:hypothetical protein
VLIFLSGDVLSVNISDFAITGPTICGVGINIANSSLQITGSHFSNLNCVVVANNSLVQLSNTTITETYSAANLTNSTFVTNGTTIADYYAIQAYNSQGKRFLCYPVLLTF